MNNIYFFDGKAQVFSPLVDGAAGGMSPPIAGEYAMRLGTIIGVPDAYTKFARIKDANGSAYTVDPGELPEDAGIDDDFAYRLDLWGNDSGLAHSLRED